MLQGLEVDDNPLLVNPAEGLELSIIYQDDVMLVINKPAEFFISTWQKHHRQRLYSNKSTIS